MLGFHPLRCLETPDTLQKLSTNLQPLIPVAPSTLDGGNLRFPFGVQRRKLCRHLCDEALGLLGVFGWGEGSPAAGPKDHSETYPRQRSTHSNPFTTDCQLCSTPCRRVEPIVPTTPAGRPQSVGHRAVGPYRLPIGRAMMYGGLRGTAPYTTEETPMETFHSHSQRPHDAEPDVMAFACFVVSADRMHA